MSNVRQLPRKGKRGNESKATTSGSTGGTPPGWPDLSEQYRPDVGDCAATCNWLANLTFQRSLQEEEDGLTIPVNREEYRATSAILSLVADRLFFLSILERPGSL